MSDPNIPPTSNNPPTEPAQKKVKARVLHDCAHGSAGDVVLVNAEEAKASAALDTTAAAVKYAEAELAKRRKAEPAGDE